MRHVITSLKSFAFIILFVVQSNGQGRSSYWHFGDSAAILFDNFQVYNIIGSRLNSVEACASISDVDGDLMYYSQYETAFNSNNQILENGSGLDGFFSSSQGALFVPNPINPEITYLIINFDSTTIQNSGHRYSVIEKNSIHSLGRIIPEEKNQIFSFGTIEQLTAVHHRNGRDIWLVLKKPNTDTMLSYLVTEEGISINPIISTVNTGSITNNFSGQLKCSANGKFLAEASNVPFGSLGSVYHFDNSTGLISEPIVIPKVYASNDVAYGCEFSANSRYVFFTNVSQSNGKGTIERYDISNYDSNSIVSSRTTIYDSSQIGLSLRALQLAVDENIYVAQSNPPNLLSRIENANSNSEVAYNELAISLSPNTEYSGLPSFIQSYFSPAYFEFKSSCASDSVEFLITSVSYDSLLWDFGDPSSGIHNKSKLANPKHLFSAADTFVVTLVEYDSLGIDTFQREIIIQPTPNLFGFENEYSSCIGDTVKIIVPEFGIYSKVQWSDGSSELERDFVYNDTLQLEISNFCDTVYDTVKIRFDPKINFELSDELFNCDMLPFEVDPKIDLDVSYKWSNGSTDSIITITKSQNLSLTVYNGCDTVADSADYIYLPRPKIPDGIPDSMCTNHPYRINFNQSDYVHFQMFKIPDTIPTFEIVSSGNYIVQAFDQCDTVTDTIDFFLTKPIAFDLEDSGDICSDIPVRINVTPEIGKINWNTGDTSYQTVVREEGRYSATVNHGACAWQGVINILSDCDDSCKPMIPNVFSPNQDGINDVFSIGIDCEIKNFELEFFNRWGSRVFVSNNHNIGWDGYVNGELASSGVYYYRLKYNYESNGEYVNETYNGSTLLLN